jgi:hypothetical protein
VPGARPVSCLGALGREWSIEETHTQVHDTVTAEGMRPIHPG